MSIFGELDAENIKSNAYFVEAGDYSAEVTDAKFQTNKDGDRQLSIEYTINDEDSQYFDSKVKQFFTLVPADMTQEKMLTLPTETQKSIRRSNSALKRTLCGNPANSSQKGLGVPASDLNDKNWDPAVLRGTKVNIGVNNYGSDGVNVRWVNLAD
jgi:hypothetical protein